MDQRTRIVRRIELTDAEGFHACLDAVARERRSLLLLQAPPLVEVERFVARNVAAGEAQAVALHGGRIVGWCDILRRTEEGCRHCGVLGMGLLAAERGRGLGRRLLEFTLSLAAQGKLERVELEVFRSNADAIRLYERIGFQHEGIRRRARLVDGVHDDLVCMALFPAWQVEAEARPVRREEPAS